jgi:hypothetical protein
MVNLEDFLFVEGRSRSISYIASLSPLMLRFVIRLTGISVSIWYIISIKSPGVQKITKYALISQEFYWVIDVKIPRFVNFFHLNNTLFMKLCEKATFMWALVKKQLISNKDVSNSTFTINLQALKHQIKHILLLLSRSLQPC